MLAPLPWVSSARSIVADVGDGVLSLWLPGSLPGADWVLELRSVYGEVTKIAEFSVLFSRERAVELAEQMWSML